MMDNRRSFLKQLSFSGLALLASPGITAAALPGKRSTAVAEGKVILFQGDSITEGGRDNTNWNHFFGQDYAYLIAGRLAYENPAINHKFFNRGISSNRVRDLQARWQADALDIRPEILSILIGVNDAYWVVENGTKDTAEDFSGQLQSLIEQTQKALPNVKLVLCEPFILPVGMVKAKLEAWTTEIRKRQLVVKQLAEKYGAVFIPLQDEFNNVLKKAPAEHWIWDGIHPMPAGHELIARAWIKSVNKHFNLF